MNLDDDFTWSFRDAETILSETDLLEELQQLPPVWDDHRQPADHSTRTELLRDIGGWEQDKRIQMGADVPDVSKTRGAAFDAYKAGVAVEHESREAMRAVWHMMKMEITYQDGTVFTDSSADGVDVGVLLIPTKASNPAGDRARRDILAVLQRYFDISVPIFVWEYSRE